MHSYLFSSTPFLWFQVFNDVHALEDVGRKNVTTLKPFEDSGEVLNLSDDEENLKVAKSFEGNTTTREVAITSGSPAKASVLPTKALFEPATTPKASSTTTSSSTTAKNKAAHYSVASRILVILNSILELTMIFFLY